MDRARDSGVTGLNTGWSWGSTHLIVVTAQTVSWNT